MFLDQTIRLSDKVSILIAKEVKEFKFLLQKMDQSAS